MRKMKKISKFMREDKQRRNNLWSNCKVVLAVKKYPPHHSLQEKIASTKNTFVPSEKNGRHKNRILHLQRKSAGDTKEQESLAKSALLKRLLEFFRFLSHHQFSRNLSLSIS